MSAALKSRRKVLMIAVGAAILLLAAGFAAGRLVRSPQQEAADAKGPGPTVLTVPVESRTLSAAVVLRGDVASGSQTDLMPPGGATAPLITRVLVRGGQKVVAAHVLVEVSGRPVFVLPGSVPAYRDLRPGLSGADVKQLQQALDQLGFHPGERNGVYGQSTKDAVIRLYESMGYEPLPASDTDAQTVQAAEESVKQAQRAVDDAVTAQQQAHRAAGAEGAGRAERDQARAADLAVTRAKDDLAEARNSRDEAIAATGPTVPLGEYVFVQSLPARVVAVKAVVGKPAPTPLLTLSSGALRATGVLPGGQAALVKRGQAVQIVDEENGLTAEGVVASVSAVAAGSGAPGGEIDGSQVVVTPKGSWDPKLWGANVRLTIKGASTGAAALVVPVSALFATADGSTRLTVRAPDGASRDVKVRVTVNTGGYAAVEALAGSLRAGDRVVISAQNVDGGTGPP